jgi:hypothetical protein
MKGEEKKPEKRGKKGVSPHAAARHPESMKMTAISDSPWYPTLRLFRQERAGDWAAVFGHMAQELAAAHRNMET